MKLNPCARIALSIGAIVLLVAGAGQSRDLRLFFGSLAGFLVLTYVAGGGRLPWRVGLRDYLFYILIALTMFACVILYALHSARATR